MEPEGSVQYSQQPPLLPILSHMHPVHTFPPCFPKDHSNIILPSMPMSSEWSLPFRISEQNFTYIPHVSYACYMPRASHACH
jgi:hypothetical protein